MKNLSAVVAIANNQVIGRGGQLPWQLSADLKRFKKLTMGHHLIMGRRTYESIGRPLPGRITIVVTRQPDPPWNGVLVVRSLPEAYGLVANDSEAFIVGGSEIYAQSLPDVERLYVTQVLADVPGDTRFPHIDWDAWQLVESSRHEADDRNTYAMEFRVFIRKA